SVINDNGIIIFGFPEITIDGAFIYRSVSVHKNIFIVVKTLFKKSGVSIASALRIVLHIGVAVDSPVVEIPVKLDFFISDFFRILKIKMHPYIFRFDVFILCIYVSNKEVSIDIRIIGIRSVISRNIGEEIIFI